MTVYDNAVEQYRGEEGIDEEKPVRVLLYDIENASLTGRAWGTWNTNILRVTQDWYLLSIAWKWLGEKEAHVLSLADFPKTFKKDFTDDSELVKAFHPIFNEADVVIGHNSNQFDNKKIHTRFIYHRLPVPSPYQQIDTLMIARRRFAFTSNRLDDLAKFFGVGRKLRIHPDVWEDCMQGDESAFRHMAKYNKMDVLILEKIYKKLRAWQPNHPYIGVSGDNRKRFSEMEGLICPRCGSSKLSSKGWKKTLASRYRAYQCLGCGGYTHSQLRLPRAKDMKAI